MTVSPPFTDCIHVFRSAVAFAAETGPSHGQCYKSFHFKSTPQTAGFATVQPPPYRGDQNGGVMPV